MTKQYLDAHPDFTATTEIEALLAMGAEDISWHNDLSPSVFYKGYQVWISDFDDEAGKPLETPLFYLCKNDDETGERDDDFTLETLAEVKEFLGKLGEQSDSGDEDYPCAWEAYHGEEPCCYCGE